MHHGRCIFNYDNKHSDAILYYGTNNELPYIRVFDDQIVIVFTLEAESGIDCHLPTPDKYDIKVSYKRDSTVPLPYFCHFIMKPNESLKWDSRIYPQEIENLLQLSLKTVEVNGGLTILKS